MGGGAIGDSDQDHSDLLWTVWSTKTSNIYSPSDQTHEKLSLVSNEMKEQKRDLTFSRANTRPVVAFGQVYLKFSR